MSSFLVSPGAEARMDLAPLTYGFALKMENYGAQKILKPFATPLRDFRVLKVPAGALMGRDPNVRRAPGTPAKRIRTGSDRVTGQIEEFAAEHGIDPSNSGPFGDNIDAQERTAVSAALPYILNEMELEVRDMLHNTTTFPLSGTTGVSLGTPWSTSATCTPRADVLTGIEVKNRLTGATKFGLQINMRQYTALCASVDIRGALNVNTLRPGAIPHADLAYALGGEYLTELVVTGGGYNTAPNGVTASISAIWGNANAFLYALPNSPDDLTSPHIGRMFKWTGPSESPGVELSQEIATDGGSIMVEQYNDPATSQRIIRVRDFADPVILHSEAGYLFGNVI